jgi:multidrug efflux system outer membrane protein
MRLSPPVIAIAGLAALALCACVDLAPRYRQPPAPIPAAFPAGGAYPDKASGAAGAEATQAAGPWREVFADPRLRAVIVQALADNRDLRLAIANVAAARAQYASQRSNLLPKLNATAGATYGQIPYSVVDGGAPGVPSGDYNERIYNVGGAVSAFQLDLFSKVRNLTRAAQEQYFASREARDAARITLIGEVASDWLTLGSDRALLAIAKDTQKSGQQSLDLTQARFKSGVASELDVSQARTVVEQARYDVARLTALIAQDRNALELVVGAPVADDLLPSDIDGAGVVLTRLPAGLPSRVLLARPDVAQAEDQLKGANANIGAARAAFFPDISLTATGGLTSLAFSSLFRGAAETWTFVPSLSQPIFDAGANRAGLAGAKAQRDAALATYEKSIQTAFREVADALAQRGQIDEQIAAQQALTEAAEVGYRLSNARYERGADTYLNALIAQRTLYAARQTLVSTRLIQATNVVTLYTSLGGGLN